MEETCSNNFHHVDFSSIIHEQVHHCNLTLCPYERQLWFFFKMQPAPKDLQQAPTAKEGAEQK